ncbi:MAG: RNase adapter RapZ [Bordetella sp.]
MQLILVTGMSGSGKSVVLNALEDSGYFCIDNLPVGFIELITESLKSRSFPRLAIAADTRMREDLRSIRRTLKRLQAANIEVRLLFLNARTDALVQRYSETRRRHPLSLRTEAVEALGLEGQEESSSLLECIEHEREILADVEQLGVQMDTTDLKPAALRAWVREFLQLKAGRISLMFQSFAYKDGIPLDADLVFDVRCLSNPYYIDELKPLTGLDPKVAHFLANQTQAPSLINDVGHFLERWITEFEHDQRSYLTVALGCTGGQHRSVYCAEQLASRFRGQWPCLVRHRGLSLKGLG